ncbi:TlpA disulfide reductase family protein [Tenuibacillus multivorans]|uniref:Thiol-disulfide isomerase or thioredoxin n=1 Tax=Tenuibacillus multivorans TaxID=237069 RepID=A0A1H0DAA8_9BACI|nr:TlpA disulfide reductase family protein [Tenuibacillus multivorans]GEL76635.1 thioredoxin [Tenuibacillus multivorans]SDN67092.1 Thiol-disulfide isomerase or thioredoxin [Tenuibacillus multivorans]
MKAPLFELPYLDEQQKSFRLEDILGEKVMVLTFWVSWCPDCARDLPKKEQFYKTMHNNNIDMITINVTDREHGEDEALKYQNQFLTQPVLKDNGREVYDLYECTSVPTTIVIDRDGEIIGRFGDQADFVEVIHTLSGEL